jgi:thymidine phosphorylase
VRTLGGPGDVLSPRFAGLARARVQIDVPAPRGGVLAAMDTREVGLAVVDLGGGRRRADDVIDPGVGLSHVKPLGTRVAEGEPLIRVHAANRDAAQAAAARIAAALSIRSRAPRPTTVVIERIAGG